MHEHLRRQPLLSIRDVTEVLDRLIDEQSRERRSLWLFFLDADAVMAPLAVPIDDIEVQPDDQLVTTLFGIIDQLLTGTVLGGSVVLALTGVGTSRGPDEQCWADALTRGAQAARVRMTALCSVASSVVRPMLAGRAA